MVTSSAVTPNVMRAIVADSHVLVAGVQPGIEVPFHHVTVRTDIRVVTQVAGPLPVAKREGAQPAQQPQGDGEGEGKIEEAS